MAPKNASAKAGEVGRTSATRQGRRSRTEDRRRRIRRRGSEAGVDADSHRPPRTGPGQDVVEVAEGRDLGHQFGQGVQPCAVLPPTHGVGEVTWGGANPAELARRYRSRISHVHTKDVRKEVMEKSKAEGWSFLDSVIEGVYTVPGDGMVDFVSVFRELPGYRGWVVIEAEQDPKKAHPLTYAKMGYANLTRYLKEAGLR